MGPEVREGRFLAMFQNNLSKKLHPHRKNACFVVRNDGLRSDNVCDIDDIVMAHNVELQCTALSRSFAAVCNVLKCYTVFVRHRFCFRPELIARRAGLRPNFLEEVVFPGDALCPTMLASALAVPVEGKRLIIGQMVVELALDDHHDLVELRHIDGFDPTV